MRGEPAAKVQLGEQAVTEPADDRSFDWVVALALFSGAAVIIPSLIALAANLVAVAAALL